MTDLNENMAPEAMLRTEIEKLTRDYNALRDALDFRTISPASRGEESHQSFAPTAQDTKPSVTRGL